MFEFLRRWHNGSSRVRPIITKIRKHKSRLQLEVLENRMTPAVFNVNSVADILDPAAGVVTLRSAIEAANATPGGNTINLTVPGAYSITLPGTPGEVDNAAGEFAISAAGGNLTIQNTSGGTVIVNGNNLSRVFDINPLFTIGSVIVTDGGQGFTSAPTVTLSGGGGSGATATATIANGQVAGVTITNPGSDYTSAPTVTFTGGGGQGADATAILASPKITVTMIGFTIENGNANGGNVPAGAGGGIRDNDNANLTLTNIILTNNTASADGGGVSMANLLDTPWVLTLNNTTVTDNHAGDQGGGVEEDGTGLVKINGGLIADNTSTNEGAGVYLDNIAEGGVFNVNVIDGGNGFTTAPTVTFTGGGGTGATGTAIISNGQVVGVSITNPGAGYILPPTITFTGGGGTGTAATANLVLGTSTLDITGTVITGNSSLDSIGGGVANSGDGVVNIASSTFTDNFAGTTGGGFSDENNVGTLNVTNSLFLDNSAAGDGGGIFVGGPTITVTGTLIEGNSSGGPDGGGGIFAGGTALTVTGSTIANNVASANGGGIELETTGSGAKAGSSITNSTLSGNSALNRTVATFGGGIDASAAFSGMLLLLNDTINGNFAASGDGVSTANAAGSSVTVENTIIAGNFANNVGGNGMDAAGAFIDNGGNLIGISGAGSGNTGFNAVSTKSGSVANPLNPLLAPLGNNGGPTVGATGDSMTQETEALLPGSPAIDSGVTANAPITDERAFARPAAGATAPSSGAFEIQPSTISVTVSPTGPPVGVGSGAEFTITVTNTGANALPADDTTVTVTLPAGLTLAAGSSSTFTVGALATGASATFTAQATATAAGPQTVTATVSSPDTNPNSVSNATTITVLSAQERFVRALYLDDLGRAGSIAELDFWVGVLNGQGGSQALVVADIAQSFEARDDLVKSWYVTYLGRAAANGEELSWVTLLQTQTQEQVLSQILATSEFFNHAQTLASGGTADQNFVQALFQLVLKRTGSAAEVAQFVNLLPTVGQQGVALAFLQSQEYREDVITEDYDTLLHRTPDAVGLTGWVTSNLDLGSVHNDFESSTEFFTNG